MASALSRLAAVTGWVQWVSLVSTKWVKSIERQGRHFNRDVIILCVRWYLRYKLRLRDLVEMMAERGLSLAHTTILRWVRRYTPEFVKRWNRFATPAGRSWRVDETYRTPSQRSPPAWG